MTRVDLIDDVDRLEELGPGWDALAVAAGRPYCSPSWQLSWWRHAAPPDAELRALAALEGHRLVGLAPFYARRGRFGLFQYRLLGSEASDRVEPLARAGAEESAAELFSTELDQLEPRPSLVTLHGLSVSSPWPSALRRALAQGETWLHREPPVPAPAIDLRGRTYEEWFAARSANFRQQMRRLRRRLDEQGASFRVSSGEEQLARDLESFASLHYSRWRSRGGSAILNPAVEGMLLRAALELEPEGRFRLHVIDVDGRTISAQIVLAAGGRASYWLGGFDEEWAAERPSLLALVHAVEHAFELGDEHFDLGGGPQEYKYRFADGEDVIETTALVPRRDGYARARTALWPRHLRQAIARRVPARQRERIHRLTRRG